MTLYILLVIVVQYKKESEIFNIRMSNSYKGNFNIQLVLYCIYYYLLVLINS